MQVIRALRPVVSLLPVVAAIQKSTRGQRSTVAVSLMLFVLPAIANGSFATPLRPPNPTRSKLAETERMFALIKTRLNQVPHVEDAPFSREHFVSRPSKQLFEDNHESLARYPKPKNLFCREFLGLEGHDVGDIFRMMKTTTLYSITIMKVQYGPF